MKFLFNPAVSISTFDSGSKEPAALCEVPTDDDKDIAKKYVIPYALLDLIKQFDGSKETSEVVTAYQDSARVGHSPQSIEKLINNFLLPNGLLIDPSAEVSLRKEPAKRKSFLYIKLPLIPPRAVAPLAKAMGWLFIRPVLFFLLALLIAGHFVFYLKVVPHYPFSLNNIRGYQILLIFALSTLTALIHELGHASALLFYRCKRAEIGWGLYLIYPVLYTDVSEAWKLKRTQRAVIDIAGMYFQALALAVLVLIFLYNPSQLLLCAIIIIDLEIANALNPFLRTDGYWLVTDLFGIHNLRKQSVELMKRPLLKIFPGARKTALPPWTLSRNASIVLGVYILLGAFFFFHLFKLITYQVLYELAPAYPGILAHLWTVLRAQPTDIWQVCGALLDVLWRSVVLLGFFLFMYRILKGCFKGLKNLLRHFFAGHKTKVAEELTSQETL